jgi:hypothetical protein
MATAIPDLWSDDIKVNVLPPVAVLKAQESLLARKTQGMLQAKLTTTETDKLVQHSLDLIAPGLNFYRERLLSATHDRDMLYPVTVTAEAFAPKPRNTIEAVGMSIHGSLVRALDPSVIQRRAATDEEFIRLVREVLHSDLVRALIHSLIARINGQNAEQPGNGPVGSEGGTSADENEAS